MKLPTKVVATLLVATAVAATVPGISQIAVPKKRRESQFDKLLALHDRKGELRAELLGISPYEFKKLSKTHALDELIRRAGMNSKRDFRMALFGRLRNELLQRGWSRARIDTYILVRAPRMV